MRIRLTLGFLLAIGAGWLGPIGVGAAPHAAQTSPVRPTANTAAPLSSSMEQLPDLEASLVAEGLDRPTFAIALSQERLLVTEKAGVIRMVVDGVVLPEPFLDLDAAIPDRRPERGLLAAAIHPDFERNGRLFVHITDDRGDSRLIEYRVSEANPDVADPRSARLILENEQPGEFHNGGMIAFGPDGYLYVAMGDGDFGDSDRNAGLLQNRLGAVLRIDVDAGNPYAVPESNPFIDSVAAPEIWLSGFRNPWRFFIDDVTRSMVIGDVGQFTWEELQVVSLDEPGLDFGWPVLEGRQCYQAKTCERDGLVLPDVVYSHGKGCAVVAGPIYRGSLIPELHEMIVYADYCTGAMSAYSVVDGSVRRNIAILEAAKYGPILSLAVDADGEILLLTELGEIRRLRPVG